MLYLSATVHYDPILFGVTYVDVNVGESNVSGIKQAQCEGR
jgi:hypothetical protein